MKKTTLLFITCLWSIITFSQENFQQISEDSRDKMKQGDYLGSISNLEAVQGNAISDSLFMRIFCDLQICYGKTNDTKFSFLELKNEVRKWGELFGQDKSTYRWFLTNIFEIYQKQNDYVNAKVYALELNQLDDKKAGRRTLDYATTLNLVGISQYRLEEYHEALLTSKEILEIREMHQGEVNDLFVAISNVIDCALACKEYNLVQDNLSKLISLADTEFGNESAKHYEAIYLEANALHRMGNYSSADKSINQYIKYTQQEGFSELYLKALLFSYNNSVANGKFKEALFRVNKLIEESEKDSSFFNYTREGYSELISLHKEKENTKGIKQAINRYLDYVQKAYGLNSNQFESLCLELVSYVDSYRIYGNYDFAHTITVSILDYFKEKKIYHYLPLSLFYSSFSILCSEMDDPKYGLIFIHRAIIIRKECMGASYIINPAFSNNEALAYFKLGNLEQAAESYNEALASIKDFPDLTGLDKNRLQVSIYASLCKVYIDLEDYEKADYYGLLALKTSEEKNSMYYLQTLINLSNLYYITGDFERGLHYCNLVVPIMDESNMQNNVYYFTNLQNKGLYLVALQRYEEASNCFNQALALLNEVGKNNFIEVRVMINNNMGMLYYELDEHVKAQKYFETALKLLEKENNTHNHTYVGILSNLAMTYYIGNNLQQAINILEKAIKVSKNISSDDILQTNLLGSCVLILDEIGEKQKAKAYLMDAYQDIEKQVYHNWAFMTEHQRELFWGQIADDYAYIYYYIFESNCQDTNLLKQAYNASLFSKGILLNSSIELDKLLLKNGDSLVVSKYHQLKSKKESQNTNSGNLLQETEILEKELLKLSKDYGNFTNKLRLKYTDIQSNLTDNGIAIEFVNFPTLNSDSIIYAALLLRKGWENPLMISLFEKKELEQLINSESIPSRIYEGAIAEKISNLIWGAILRYLNEGDELYFASSGILHLIAMESLPSTNGLLMGERYKMHRLSSTKELCNKSVGNNYNKAVLYGGLTYDLDRDIMEAQSHIYNTEYNLYAKHSFYDTLNRSGWRELPGTRVEVEKIAQTLQNKGILTTIREREKGNEESFRALSGQKFSIIHLATHGFFLPIQEANRHTFFSMLNHNKPIPSSPMLRSGLILSGGNKAWKGESLPQGIEDGVLTAQEISSLDLREIDLVVLSACETGLGEIMADGVFELQRALKKAGVQTLIMSLWKVSDKTTEMLMSEFYKNLASGRNKRESFFSAQMFVRKQYPESYYWAGFIMLD